MIFIQYCHVKKSYMRKKIYIHINYLQKSSIYIIYKNIHYLQKYTLFNNNFLHDFCIKLIVISKNSQNEQSN
jgi:hypothetical protein